ncbi:DNA-processing protein DprA [Candidatus Poribacteria bacterium]|nr:DNA-processing protein DprA [Candidatus Poribacteria bacterium]
MRARILKQTDAGEAAIAVLEDAADSAGFRRPLHFHGNAELLAMPLISMAGSRRAEGWSLTSMEALAGHLTLEGACVVSGGALGTDLAAHRGALQAGGCTIVIPPCALEAVHLDSWRRGMAATWDMKRTLFLSPFRAGERIDQRNAPIVRNRLIAALASGAIAGETGLTGGTNHFIELILQRHVPLFFLDSRPPDPALRRALRTIEQRGGSRFTAAQALERRLARHILAAAHSHQTREQSARRLQPGLFDE